MGRQGLNEIRSNLRETVNYLAGELGQRSLIDVRNLDAASRFIEERFRSYGYEVLRQPFVYEGRTYCNISAVGKEHQGRKDRVIVVGAHYDTVVGTPGADDNASGIAVLLELARLCASSPTSLPVRFAAFSLEEPPVFMTRHMGSYIYARSLKDEGVDVIGMMSLEMVGYYTDREGSQIYPVPLLRPFYPDRGNFIAFVGNLASRRFTKKFRDAFRAASSLPAETLNAPSLLPGVDFSDHRNFWKFGFPAFMVTDTAFYRNPNYHNSGDKTETLDFDRMAELAAGLHKALKRFE